MGDLACKTLIASHGFHTVFLAAFLEEKNEWDGRSSRCFSCKNQACQSLSLQMPDARSTHRFPASRESGTVSQHVAPIPFAPTLLTFGNLCCRLQAPLAELREATRQWRRLASLVGMTFEA